MQALRRQRTLLTLLTLLCIRVSHTATLDIAGIFMDDAAEERSLFLHEDGAADKAGDGTDAAPLSVWHIVAAFRERNFHQVPPHIEMNVITPKGRAAHRRRQW